jgi:flagellar hook-associated protein 2
MTISFGGLATGLDTSALIEGLLEVERQPLVRLEADKVYFNNRLSAYSEFNSTLTSLLSKAGSLDSASELQPQAATLSKDDFFSATAASTATTGTYQLKAFSLAQVEKQVSDAGQFADKSTTLYKTGTLVVTANGESTEITIDTKNNTLAGIAQAINDADAGVTATVISDGAASNPYRLVLTADSIPDTVPDYDGADDIAGNGDDETDISLDTSGLNSAGGADFNPTFSVVQEAQQAHIQVDTVDIYSSSNTFTEAISGVTLTMDAVDNGATSTTLSVKLDKEELQGNISSFVSDYNKVMSYITGQSTYGNTEAGILSGDASLRQVKARLQSLLTTRIAGSGSINTLAELGLETQKDGTVKINDSTLSAAIDDDLDSVVKLLAGEGSGSAAIDGIATKFSDYLTDITNSTDGFLAGRKASNTSTIKRIDSDIQRLEQRLEKREESLQKQFSALEQLISTFNSQSDYLSQQMSMLSSLWSKR